MLEAGELVSFCLGVGIVATVLGVGNIDGATEGLTVGLVVGEIGANVVNNGVVGTGTDVEIEEGVNSDSGVEVDVGCALQERLPNPSMVIRAMNTVGLTR